MNKVHLYSGLRKHTGNVSPVEVNGSTVGECLEALFRKYPGLRPVLTGKKGKLSDQVYVSINMNSPYSETWETPLKSGDELHIVLIIVGG